MRTPTDTNARDASVVPGRQPGRGRSYRRWTLAIGGLLALAVSACTATGAPGSTRAGSAVTKHRSNQTVTTAAHGSPGKAAVSPPTVGAAATPAAPAPAPATATGARWRPPVGARWQIQLTTPVDQSVDAPIYDIDGDLNSKAVVDALHAKGRKVICYIDAGAAESYRSDFARFPASVLGRTVDGWPEERWLDVRQIEQLRPVMSARMDMCRAKGFDAVDPDMVEAYAADSGFPITYQDQLTYNRFLAQLAHERGLSVGLKGDVDQIRDLVDTFDFTVNEECSVFNECDVVAAFARAGKAVFHIEYDQPKTAYCAQAKSLGFSSLRKRLSLDAWLDAC